VFLGHGKQVSHRQHSASLDRLERQAVAGQSLFQSEVRLSTVFKIALPRKANFKTERLKVFKAKPEAARF
jgi:hypothetical protein